MRIIDALYVVVTLVCAVLGLGDPVVLVLVVAALVLALRYRAGAVLMTMGTVGLLNNAYSPLLSAALIPSLDRELREGSLRWYYCAASLGLSALLSAHFLGLYSTVAYAVPPFYVVILVLANLVRYTLIHVTVVAEGELRVVAGDELRYRLRLVTRPRVKAMVTIRGPRAMRITPNPVLINGEAWLDVFVKYVTGGVRRPRLVVEFVDSRRLVRVRRVVRHPPVVVVSRTQWAMEIAREYLLGGTGDVVGLREYAPGDPLRRIHWKKSVRLDRYVIKLQAPQRRLNILLIPYASSEAAVDRLGSALVLLAARGAAVGGLTITVFHRDGSARTLRVSKDNFWDVLSEALGTLENLDVRYVGGAYLDHLEPVRATVRGRVMGLMDEYTVILGERTWLRWICGGLRCIMV